MSTDQQAKSQITDIGPPLVLTSRFENRLLWGVMLLILIVAIFFCSVNISRKISLHGQLLSVNAEPINPESAWAITLYIQSGELGALKTGDKINIELNAFPSRRYGLQPAQIVSIGLNPANNAELPFLNPADVYYQVQVALPAGCTMSPHVCQLWREGMRVNTHVVVEKYTVFERIFNPLIATESAEK